MDCTKEYFKDSDGTNESFENTVTTTVNTFDDDHPFKVKLVTQKELEAKRPKFNRKQREMFSIADEYIKFINERVEEQNSDGECTYDFEHIDEPEEITSPLEALVADFKGYAEDNFSLEIQDDENNYIEFVGEYLIDLFAKAGYTISKAEEDDEIIYTLNW